MDGSDNLPMPEFSPLQYTPNTNAALLQSSSQTRASADSTTEMCVICNDAPVYRDGLIIYPTCGMACASKLRAACGLPNTNRTYAFADTPIGICVVCSDAPMYRNGTNIYPTCGMACASNLRAPCGPSNTDKAQAQAPTSDPPNGASGVPQNNANITGSDLGSRPIQSQIGMCNVCHVRPRLQRGGKIYAVCGSSCAAKLLGAPGLVEMCDYCKKRPKVVIDGKTYPQCGKTCRDKAKLAKTLCILCGNSTIPAGELYFCSKACQSLADISAPFLIEIPPRHDIFERVAEIFTSEWQTSETHCPNVKRIYRIVMRKGNFEESFMKYCTKRYPAVRRKRDVSSVARSRWLLFSRECAFGDPGNVEPCSSKKCLLCSIVRSSFNRSDFPSGIKTSGLNRAIELCRPTKIAALINVIVGREAEMSPREVQTASVHQLPPQNTDSVHIIGVRSDGSRVDMGDIIVYDGDAVFPRYLIFYE